MAFTASDKQNLSKPAFYRELCVQLGELVKQETNLVANAANAAALLFQTLPDVNWVGFYFTEDRELVLGPFQGRPACTRIAFGKGVCGASAVSQTTVIVPDVEKYPEHIACDARSKSEIVVPLLNWGRLLGVLDVDSPILNRFDEDDEEGLESIAAVLLSSIVTNDLPDFSESASSE